MSNAGTDNWDEHPELQQVIPWRSTSRQGPSIAFEAAVSGAQWFIRLNDFPDEPLYTLLIDGHEIIHFDEWPQFWGPRPGFAAGEG